jgi:hypothetical protein
MARTDVLALLAACALPLACARNPAPAGALPRVNAVMTDGFGGWIEAVRLNGTPVAGELLAANADTVWILNSAGLAALPGDSLRNATLALYEARSGGLGAWVALGTLGTISNGSFLIFTAPLWLIVGTTTAARASRQPLYRWNPSQSFDEIRRFARFPAGIPANVDRSSLRLPARMR